MKRILEIEKEYTRFKGIKAINYFFNTHPELEYWREQFEWMLENGVSSFSDNIMNDGTKNKNWSYALQFDNEENYSYICIIERA